jgi:hypothetical protein
MSISFVLLWWHIPAALCVIGCLLMFFGTRTYIGAFGWPDTELTGVGFIGAIAAVIGVVLFIGGLFRGLF